MKVESYMQNNNIQNKSFQFVIRIVNMCKLLRDDRKETILLKQLLRSGTSIGANVAEAQNAQSRADFLSKLSIALKEATETEYWLRLLEATDYLTAEEFSSIHGACVELERILFASVKKLKR